jgi:hypothetical protein
VAQKDGIDLPRHVGAFVKNKEVYNSVHLLVNLYTFGSAWYKTKKKIWSYLNLLN